MEQAAKVNQKSGAEPELDGVFLWFVTEIQTVKIKFKRMSSDSDPAGTGVLDVELCRGPAERVEVVVVVAAVEAEEGLNVKLTAPPSPPPQTNSRHTNPSRG